jgi:hypothetical protein
MPVVHGVVGFGAGEHARDVQHARWPRARGIRHSRGQRVCKPKEICARLAFTAGSLDTLGAVAAGARIA